MLDMFLINREYLYNVLLETNNDPGFLSSRHFHRKAGDLGDFCLKSATAGQQLMRCGGVRGTLTNIFLWNRTECCPSGNVLKVARPIKIAFLKINIIHSGRY